MTEFSLKAEIFGESHSEKIGVVLTGVPKGKRIDLVKLQEFCDQRKSTKNPLSTARRESDILELAEGIEDGQTTGGRIVIEIKNEDVRKSDYENISTCPRPSHADYCAYLKYGSIPSGGGSFSGRMTLPLCAAGGIAKQLLAEYGIIITAYLSELGGKRIVTYKEMDNFSIKIEEDSLKSILSELAPVIKEGDSIGGVVECMVFGMPGGVGGPLFDGLEGRISAAVFAVPAVKGIEFGLGFDLARMKGSTANDGYRIADGRVVQKTNNNGGIYGGISSGAPITFRVAFKPTPSIALEQDTVDLKENKNTVIKISGRHDACVALRGAVAIEAAAALALYGAILFEEENKKNGSV